MAMTAKTRDRLRTAAVVLAVTAAQWGGAVASVLMVPAAARAQARHHPEEMTAAERRRYYDAYNASRTPARWDSIRRATAAARAASAEPPAAAPAMRPPATAAGVVSFRMRNRGLRPVRVEVAGSVLDFGPYETRYVQFPPASRIYAYDAGRPDGRGRLLFAVTRADEGRVFGVHR